MGHCGAVKELLHQFLFLRQHEANSSAAGVDVGNCFSWRNFNIQVPLSMSKLNATASSASSLHSAVVNASI